MSKYWNQKFKYNINYSFQNKIKSLNMKTDEFELKMRSKDKQINILQNQSK